MKYRVPAKPKSSKEISNVVIGQFVTPQNTEAIPRAAQKEGDMEKILPKRQPKVAPTKKDGTISPPRYPAPRVRAVNIIFNKKA